MYGETRCRVNERDLGNFARLCSLALVFRLLSPDLTFEPFQSNPIPTGKINLSDEILV